MTTDSRFHLGRDAESQLESLLARWDTAPGFELAVVISPHASARAEVAARLAGLGRVRPFEPKPSIVGDLEDGLANRGAARPIVWVEARRFSTSLWSAGLSAMDGRHERLRLAVDGLIVLAGPPELLPLMRKFPDLERMLTTIMSVDDAPSASSPVDLRWLHLSDLHFEDHERSERREVLSSLIDHLADEVVAKGLRPDFVMVTGDIAQSGRAEEYEQAEGFFLKLMDALGLDARQHLFVVPGNHDVDRKAVSRMTSLLTADLLEGEDQAQVEATLRNSDELQALGQRLRAFYAFTHRLLGPARAWSADRPWRADRVDVRGFPVGLVQLNTAWASGPEDAKGKLLVGDAQLAEALAELPDVRLRIAMMHHPPAWLPDFDSSPLERRLADATGTEFLLHGHVHDEDTFVRMGPGGWLMQLSAATAYVKGRWDNGYSIVALDGTTGRGQIHYFAFSEKGAGRWHPDSSRHKDAEHGVWTFPLPAALHDDSDTPAASAPPAERTPDQHSALIARYRAQSAAVHGLVSFVGIPDHSRRSVRATVVELFAPLLALPRGAADPDDDEAGTPVSELVRRLIQADINGDRGRLLVLGEPGSGKTTLTRFLSVWASGGAEIDGVERPEGLVPLRVPFREYVEDQQAGHCEDLLGFLVRQSRTLLNAPRDGGFFERVLNDGQALVLLDGLDEVGDPALRDSTSRYVSAVADTWPKSAFLVTSRIVGYEEAPLQPRRFSRTGEPIGRRSPGFDHLVLRKLTRAAREELVRRWYRTQIPDDARERDRMTSDLLAALDVEAGARDLARNPLLATLVCLVHRQEATLPGRRVDLYEKVIHTLLQTRPEATNRNSIFREIPPGLQRAYLQALALRMQHRRAEADDGTPRSESLITIGRAELVDELVSIAQARGLSEDVAVTGDRMDQWIRWLAARAGLLVEQKPGRFEFLHLTLLEYLAAFAWTESATGSGGFAKLVPEVIAAASSGAWREVCRLVMGLNAQRVEFVNPLLAACLPGGQEAVILAFEGLREELAVPETQLRELIGAVLNVFGRYEGHFEETELHLVGLMVDVARFSEQNRDAVRTILGEALSTHEDARALPAALLAAVPRLVADAATALRVIDHLRNRTSEGEQLYFLWDAIDETVRIWPEAAAEALSLQTRFFDHLEAPDRALFETVDSKLDGRVPLWCSIPAGTFLMGSPEGKGDGDEHPQHRVTLSQPFHMAAAPVTNRQYGNFDPKFSPQKWERVADSELLDHPAVNVSWHAAVSFCRWLSARADWAAGARLPTEAEWEYACRAHTQSGLDYWSGDGAEKLAHAGWFSGNSEGRTHRVAEKPRNTWSSPGEPPRGLYDLHGNVLEWTADWFGRDYYAESPETDPPGPDGGEGRVVRGGSWVASADWARAAYRGDGRPAGRFDLVGFRVVLPVPGIGSRS